MAMTETKYAEYLGYGVYAHYDNLGNVVLTTGHHDELHANQVIYMEPEVVKNLVNYLAALPGKIKEEKQ